MSRYRPPAPAAGAIDPFAATRTRMEEMLAHLSAPVMAAATAEALEEYVTVAGRELLRQVLQDQFDARAAAEARLAAVAGTDTVVRRRAECGHRRLLSTRLGRVEVTRIAYRAKGAPNLHPADAALALPVGIHSYPLQRSSAPARHRAGDRAGPATAGGRPPATGHRAGIGPPAVDGHRGPRRRAHPRLLPAGPARHRAGPRFPRTGEWSDGTDREDQGA